jgi:hypothetical protein
MAMPSQPGVTSAFLSAVSCTSPRSCVAVGNSTTGSGVQTAMAEAWDGTNWNTETTPDPAGSSVSGLSAVSCRSGGACIAVGRSTDGDGSTVTLTEDRVGTVWNIQPSPSPAGALTAGLYGVSCITAHACVAVGASTSHSGTSVAIAESLRGSKWSLEAVPQPVGSDTTALDAISCLPSGACTAVGNETNGSSIEVALAEGWNGVRWTVETTPNPTGGTPSSLGGVSCNSGTSCIAVGTDDRSTATSAPVAERWNGTSWALQSVPDPGGVGASAELAAVSCPSRHDCRAAGVLTTRAGTSRVVGEAWEGTRWSVEVTPSPAGAATSALEGVSCGTPRSCVAVGNFTDGSGTGVPLAESWDGRSWVIEPVQVPAGAVASALYGVSCTAADACVAVGAYTTGSDVESTLAELWNGSTWVIQASPNPPDAATAALAGVSCSTAVDCTAVGAFTDGSGVQVTMAERLNGAGWSIESTPNPPATSSALYAVSCPSPRSCRAIGFFTNVAGTSVRLTEQLSETGWHIRATAGPIASAPSFLHGIWCGSVASCHGVGASTDSAGASVTAAEVWDGSAWRRQTTAEPVGATSGDLYGVSCDPTTRCTAVGTYSNRSGNVLALVETSSS